MLCERCKQNKAVVHMQEIVNNEKQEMHLCQSCAKEMEMPISFTNFLQGFLDYYFGSAEINDTLGKSLSIDFQTSCPKCGLTYDGFRKTSKLGCSECYSTFRKELAQVLKNIQGSVTHQGKFPIKSGAELLRKREVDALRLSLAKAIENEEYEQAAQIRDKIKELEALK